jgi:hypothetical protein
MSQKPVITVEDITNVALEERRPGCEKGMLHEDAPVQTAVYRVQPGSGVPTHLHARVYDLFVGVKGDIEIRYEASTATACSCSSRAHFVECRPACGTRYRIRVRKMKRVSCSCKPRRKVSITCRRRSALLRRRCRSRRAPEPWSMFATKHKERKEETMAPARHLINR